MPWGISVERGRLCLRASTYDPGLRAWGRYHLARWNAQQGAWELPATSGAARHLLGVQGVDLHTDPEAEALLAAARAEDLPLPSHGGLSFSTPPWEHQRRGVDHLLSRSGGALLDMGMGTGKTKVTLDALMNLEGIHRVLVVAPKSVCPVWGEQIEIHAPEGIDVLILDEGSVAKRAQELACFFTYPLVTSGIRMVVLNWDTIWREVMAKVIRSSGVDVIIADEVHLAKNPGSRRSRFLGSWGSTVPRRWGLSGTPLAHSPLDAYAIFRFLDGGVFGSSFARFRSRYAIMGGYEGRQVIGITNKDELSSRMAPLTFSASRDLLDLPEAVHVDIPITLPRNAALIYRELEDEMIVAVEEGIISVTNALTKLLRLQQITSGFLPIDESGELISLGSPWVKTQALTDLFRCSDPTEAWVVFCRFRSDLDEIAHAAEKAGRKSWELSGRVKELGAWKEHARAGAGPVLATQIQAGGLGVSMVEARYCAYYSLGYSLAEFEQSLARVHRPGQDRPVTYYHLICRGTVDRTVRQALAKRANAIEEVLDMMREQSPQHRRPVSAGGRS